jgi:hypothetical protein
MAAGTGGYTYLGTLRRQHARQLKNSWSIGCETMDRDYTTYRHWRSYLGPLGCNKARIQAGWAKTEKTRGHYDWAWLDEIIPDMVEQGVKPWVCLCYGNALYAPKVQNAAGLGSNPPADPEALAAWERFVAAFAERYGRYVDEWEIWNEPRHGRAIAVAYTDFLIRTATVLRRVQPQAKIFGFACFGMDAELIDHGLAHLAARGKLDLLDEITFHPYSKNPDATYGRSAGLADLVRIYSDRIRIRQAEYGDASTEDSRGMMARMGPCSETIQAKAAIRRMLGDHGRGIPSGYFTICDIHYPDRILRYGLLHTNPDQTIHHAKPAYRAVQHVASVFDDSLQRRDGFAWYQAGLGYEPSPYSVFGYETRTGGDLVTLWRNDDQPRNSNALHPVHIVLPRVRIERPVWVDVRTGAVYGIPPGDYERLGQRLILPRLPVYDSPILLTDAAVLAIDPDEPNPFPLAVEGEGAAGGDDHRADEVDAATKA